MNEHPSDDDQATDNQRPRLTGCIIPPDKIQAVLDCLERMVPYIDEIIVVDMEDANDTA